MQTQNPAQREDVRSKISSSRKNPEQYRSNKRNTALRELGAEFLIIDDPTKIDKDALSQYTENNKSTVSTVIKKRCPNIYKFIDTSFTGNTFSEKLYCYIKSITTTPVCASCGTTVKFLDSRRGYQEYCSLKCSTKGTARKAKSKWIANWFPRKLESLKNIITPNFDISTYSGVDKKYSFSCVSCNTKFKDHLDDGRIPKCPNCFTTRFSKPQNEIGEFIKNLGFEIETDTRKYITPYELDIYVPYKNLAIEFNGDYYHSSCTLESKDEKCRHLNKLKRCEDAGIRLIQIFENEYINKKEIVLSRIKNLVGKTDTVGGRECEIVENPDGVDSFLKENHIQGSDNSSIKVGLMYKNELVSVMTFGTPRFNKNYQFELIRFCNKKDLTVMGGASKLLMYFVNKHNPKSIISYADRCWSSGDLYRKLGFDFLYNTSPGYYYTKNFNVVSRHKCRKELMPTFLSKYDPTKPEWWNMFENGYRRIWNCGSNVFVKHITIT